MPTNPQDVKRHCREIDRCNQRGGRMLSIVDLLDAGTVTVELAGYLSAAIGSGSSFMVGAMPGGVGKTTVMGALLLDPAIAPFRTRVCPTACTCLACPLAEGEYRGVAAYRADLPQPLLCKEGSNRRFPPKLNAYHRLRREQRR